MSSLLDDSQTPITDIEIEGLESILQDTKHYLNTQSDINGTLLEWVVVRLIQDYKRLRDSVLPILDTVGTGTVDRDDTWGDSALIFASPDTAQKLKNDSSAVLKQFHSI